MKGFRTQRAVKEWLERIGGEGLALTELRPFRSWTFLAMSILILIIFWRSARAEWLEWREGWLQRSGASPLRGARRRMRRVGRMCLRVRGTDMGSRSGCRRGRGRGRGRCRGWGVWSHCLLVRGLGMGSGCVSRGTG